MRTDAYHHFGSVDPNIVDSRSLFGSYFVIPRVKYRGRLERLVFRSTRKSASVNNSIRDSSGSEAECRE